MRSFVVIAFLILLASCEAVLGVESVSTMATGKPLSDHVISAVSGKDCSTVRTQTGQNYCVEDDIPPRQNIFCYRTLGKVTCYDKPDPYKGRHQLLGDNSTSLPAARN